VIEDRERVIENARLPCGSTWFSVDLPVVAAS
jgi:hypothetical protein